MSDRFHPSRRLALAMAGSLVLIPAFAQGRPKVVVTKDPNCGCCGGWIEHLRRNGYRVDVIEANDLRPLKMRLGVPPKLYSCHTAELEGYVLEGHVPAHAIERLLAERPKALGLSVPGMPIGSPGMEGGTPETYEVLLFDRGGLRSVFGRYREDRPV